ncbi:hypothetical protein ACFL1Q_02745 [Patescibacteria group bacterium]
MKSFLDNLEKYLKFYFIISIVALSALSLFLFKRLYKIETHLATLKNETLVKEVDVCGEGCNKQITSAVSDAIATVSGETKTIIQEKTITAPSTKSSTQTTYIPFSGPVTTTSSDWIDAPGTDVYIDLANDYGKGAYITWEGFLSIADGNGQAFARLYDATHSIAVDGSEISTTNASSTQVPSGKLNLWAGRNLYRVQLKSLNTFVVTFASGRIKISY